MGAETLPLKERAEGLVRLIGARRRAGPQVAEKGGRPPGGFMLKIIVACVATAGPGRRGGAEARLAGQLDGGRGPRPPGVSCFQGEELRAGAG